MTVFPSLSLSIEVLRPLLLCLFPHEVFTILSASFSYTSTMFISVSWWNLFVMRPFLFLSTLQFLPGFLSFHFFLGESYRCSFHPISIFLFFIFLSLSFIDLFIFSYLILDISFLSSIFHPTLQCLIHSLSPSSWHYFDWNNVLKRDCICSFLKKIIFSLCHPILKHA